MTRKDYIRLARAFARTRPDEDGPEFAAWAQIRYAVELELQADNGAFDRRRFLEACNA